MAANVDVRELRQNLSRYLDRVKGGESLVVIPTGRLEEIAERLEAPGAPAGATDAFLAESRRDRYDG